jgi:DNA processing protein
MSVRGGSAAVVALMRSAGCSWHECCSALLSGEDPEALLERHNGLFAERLLDAAHRDIARWQERHIRLITVLDPDYPENLKSVADRPPLVFMAGRMEQNDDRAVAVIGSRRPSLRGLASARAVAKALVDGGFTVTSGLAAGIDTAAHTTALECGGRTIAVIGTGLMRCYPAENRELQQRIAHSGAVVSRFWPNDPPTRQSFPLRNAVMSAISLANVIVEATETSGARIQARLALAQGRPVLLMASLLEQSWAQELASRPGTYTFETPSDVPSLIDGLAAEPLAA